MVGHRFKTSLQFKRRIEDINSATQSAAQTTCPPTLPGYRRTAYLIRLIRYLNEFPVKDYVMIPPNVRDDPFAISLDTLQGATAFIIM